MNLTNRRNIISCCSRDFSLGIFTAYGQRRASITQFDLVEEKLVFSSIGREYFLVSERQFSRQQQEFWAKCLAVFIRVTQGLRRAG